ncbi:MAG TPA: flavodoxin family protein [Syntrophorhabdaceae bacterium]|nr:flavodoxin family protein [Syntrophorhabdaceae bacterium]
MMKVVAFNGSPRVGGNTDILLGEALGAVQESGNKAVLFRLNDMNLKPCQNCGACEQNGKCVIEDDMKEIYAAIREAERIIVASPVFFFGLSAQTKTMIDRCQALWCEKYLLKKTIPEGKNGRKGLLIIVGGMRKDIGIQCGDATAKAFFRSVSIPVHETVGFLGVDKKGVVVDHPTALLDVYRAGQRLVAP